MSQSNSKKVKPVVCYQVQNLPEFDNDFYALARNNMSLIETVAIKPRDASCFKVTAGQIFRIVCSKGPQVGDLNLWNSDNLHERFYSGKTRQLHATHLTQGHRLWSNLPYMRYIASIIHDSLAWYDFDEDGAGIHDVIGTRCDPYTNKILNERDYDYCCHSNLLRAFSQYNNISLKEAEPYIHDVLNVFMCTGFTKDSHQYFMKASPVKKGDYIEFFAETNLLAALSACPGGDCSTSHSDDMATCYPLEAEIYQVDQSILKTWQEKNINQEKPQPYLGNHGLL